MPGILSPILGFAHRARADARDHLGDPAALAEPRESLLPPRADLLGQLRRVHARNERRPEDDGDHRARPHRLGAPERRELRGRRSGSSSARRRRSPSEPMPAGWRIIRTMGTRIAKIDPPQGFAAQTACAGILWTTAHFGFPVSTTQTITGSVMGAGASRRFSAVRWGIAGNIVIAWVLTLPAAGTRRSGHGSGDENAGRRPHRVRPRGGDRGRRVPRPALRNAAAHARARVATARIRASLAQWPELPIRLQ